MIDFLLADDELPQTEKDMLLRYRKSRDSSEMHNEGFWETAKKLRLGGPKSYKLAMSRHMKLGKRSNTWLVAYFTATSQTKTRKEIGEKLGIGVDGVKYHKQRISQIISKEYGHQLGLVGMADDGLITRWFLGL